MSFAPVISPIITITRSGDTYTGVIRGLAADAPYLVALTDASGDSPYLKVLLTDAAGGAVYREQPSGYTLREGTTAGRVNGGIVAFPVAQPGVVSTPVPTFAPPTPIPLTATPNAAATATAGAAGTANAATQTVVAQGSSVPTVPSGRQSDATATAQAVAGQATANAQRATAAAATSTALAASVGATQTAVAATQSSAATSTAAAAATQTAAAGNGVIPVPPNPPSR